MRRKGECYTAILVPDKQANKQSINQTNKQQTNKQTKISYPARILKKKNTQRLVIVHQQPPSYSLSDLKSFLDEH